jgi:hypothetical protein
MKQNAPGSSQDYQRTLDVAFMRVLHGEVPDLSVRGEKRDSSREQSFLTKLKFAMLEVQIQYLSSFSWFGIFLFNSFNYSK